MPTQCNCLTGIAAVLPGVPVANGRTAAGSMHPADAMPRTAGDWHGFAPQCYAAAATLIEAERLKPSLTAFRAARGQCPRGDEVPLRCTEPAMARQPKAAKTEATL